MKQLSSFSSLRAEQKVFGCFLFVRCIANGEVMKNVKALGIYSYCYILFASVFANDCLLKSDLLSCLGRRCKCSVVFVAASAITFDT